MRQIVYYGCGNNLKTYEQNFVAETGMPVCICDVSEEKQNKTYTFSTGETRKIISLERVKNEYPDYELWVTLASNNLLSVYNYLTSEKCIIPGRIKFWGNKEFRLGCYNLENYIYFSSNNVKTCAHYPYTNHFFFEKDQILTKEDIINKLDDLEKWRLDTIDKLRNNQKTSCNGCSGLRYGIWSKKPHVEIIGVGPNFAGGTKCNCNCFYCNQNSIIREKSTQKLSNYDIHRIASEYYDTLDTTILADGEPSILPDIDKLCDLASEKGWSVQLNTNAIIYKEKLANVIACNNRSFLAVALDSGCKETYKRIKRVDKFEQVIDNLYKYKEKGCYLILKYILIPDYNDNIEEITKFIDICKKLDVTHVTLSQNLSGFVDGIKHCDDPNMPESMFCLFTYMVARLQEENIHWDFQIEFINKHDYDRMERLRR